ncbi:Vacuolar protein sorting-associated protein 41 -like protein [Halotydeus destructor]|nr:Vacuolar protein sorting-associated protein 41 -like protein [Halotydeus destructor]
MIFDRPVRAVAVDPQFSTRSSARRFVTGSDCIKLHEKTFLMGYKSQPLLVGDGQVRSIKWHGQFIAWASDLNIRIYDVEEKAIITVIRRDHDSRLRPEIYRCNLFWKDKNTLLVGWGDSVKICVIKRKIPAPISPDLPKKYVEIVSMFSTSYCISGISSIDDKNLVLLGTNKQEALETTGVRPLLLVLETHPSDYSELSSDILSPRGFAAYQCHDYHLGALAEEDAFYFVVCPKDVILAKPREEDDHITWLLERYRYAEALDAVQKNRSLRKYTVLDVGKKYLEHLMSDGESSSYNMAAEICPSILGDEKKNWEYAVNLFSDKDQLHALAPYLPTGPEVVLEKSTYENVIMSFLQSDTEEFFKLVKKWPQELYDNDVLIQRIMEVDTLQADEHLNRALAELYTNEGEHEKALEIYLQLGDSECVFRLIQDFQMYSVLKERLVFLFQLNGAKASQILLDNQDKISMDHVIAKLRSKPSLLWIYLDKIVEKDPEQCSQHHDLLVELYAAYAPERLLPFLRTATNYSLEKASQICQSKNLVSEMVYLNARMGNIGGALHYITDSLNDIHRAIDFCIEHGDKDLWNDLINKSIDKPNFIRVLLENVSHIPDPVYLINSIPEKMEIDGFKECLLKMFQECNSQVSELDTSRNALVDENFDILENLYVQQRRAIPVRDDAICSGCSKSTFANGMRYISDVAVFNCRHIFHEECLDLVDGASAACAVCEK